MERPRVSVIVAARDAPEGVARLMERLGSQTLAREDFEIVVVDDGSAGTATAEAAAGGGAHVVRRQRSGGAYVARHAGVARAAAPVLAFTDADCLPRSDWLENGLRALEQHDAGLAGGHVEVLLESRPTVAALIDLGRHLHQERNVAAGFGATANLFVRRAVYDAIGGFDQRLRSGGDLEFGLRATAHGHRLLYAASAVVEHPARSAGSELAAKSLRLGRSRAQLATMDHPALRARTPLWSRPGAWAPGALLRAAPVHGQERIEAAIGTLGFRRRLALRLGEWAYVQLPLATGDLLGTAAQRRARSAAANGEP